MEKQVSVTITEEDFLKSSSWNDLQNNPLGIAVQRQLHISADKITVGTKGVYLPEATYITRPSFCLEDYRKFQNKEISHFKTTLFLYQ